MGAVSDASDATSTTPDGAPPDASDAGASPLGPQCAPAPQVYGNLRTVWSLALGSGTLAGEAIDPANNIVVAGSTSEPLTVGGTIIAAPALREPFVVHLDPAGKLLSSVALPGPAEAEAMGVDGQGNVYLAGSFTGSPDFGNGPLSGSLFLVKLDPAGKALWSHGYPVYETFLTASISTGTAPSMTVDAAGDVALAGIWSAPVDFGGGPPAGGQDLGGFVVEFDAGGNYRFSHALNDYNDSLSAGAKIQFDADGNLAISGSSSGDLGLGNSPSTTSRTAFVVKLDPAGNVLWQAQEGTFDTATAVATGATTTYVAGNFAGQFGITSPVLAYGALDTFVAGFDGTGRPTFEAPFRSNAQLSALAADPSGGVVAIGAIEGIGDLGGGSLSGSGSVLAKYDEQGHSVFSALFGTAGRLSIPSVFGQSVAIDGTGAIVTSGQFWQSIDLGSGVLAEQYNPDDTTVDATIFVAKYVEQAPAPSPNTAVDCPPNIDATWLPTAGSLMATAGGTPLVAVSADTLYWSTGTEVMGEPFDGGPPAVVAFDQKNIVALATDTGSLYWANSGATSDLSLDPGNDGQIQAAPFDGGAVVTLASGLPHPEALAVDETGVYWTSGNNLIGDGGTAPGVLMGLPRDGGAASVLWSGIENPHVLAARSGVIVFDAEGDAGPEGLSPLVDIVRTTSAGDAAVTLSTAGYQSPSSIALDSTNAYWWEYPTGNADVVSTNARLRSVPLAGGTTTTILDNQDGTGTLVADGSELFIATVGWASNYGGIYSLSTGTDASSTTLLLDAKGGISNLAVDDKHVAWVQALDSNGLFGIFVQTR